jgi:hypothetical protein
MTQTMVEQDSPKSRNQSDRKLKLKSAENFSALQLPVTYTVQGHGVEQSDLDELLVARSSALIPLECTAAIAGSGKSILGNKEQEAMQNKSKQELKQETEVVERQRKTSITSAVTQRISKERSLMHVDLVFKSAGLPPVGTEANVSSQPLTPMKSTGRDHYGQGVAADLDSQEPSLDHVGGQIPPLLLSSRKAPPEERLWG